MAYPPGTLVQRYSSPDLQYRGVPTGSAQADNVRAALVLVATGAARYGIVYRTDARLDKGVSVVATLPATSHPPVVYPTAAISDAPRVTAYLSHLRSDAARHILTRHGFTPPP